MRLLLNLLIDKVLMCTGRMRQLVQHWADRRSDLVAAVKAYYTSTKQANGQLKVMMKYPVLPRLPGANFAAKTRITVVLAGLVPSGVNPGCSRCLPQMMVKCFND